MSLIKYELKALKYLSKMSGNLKSVADELEKNTWMDEVILKSPSPPMYIYLNTPQYENTLFSFTLMSGLKQCFIFYIVI